MLHHPLTENGGQSKKVVPLEIPTIRDEDIQDGDEIAVPLTRYTNKIREDEDSDED